MNSSLGLPELSDLEMSQLFSFFSTRPFPPPNHLRYEPINPGCHYLRGQSPLEKSLVLSPFLDGLLAQLTTLDILRFTNVSNTVRAYTYGHTPSFRVLNLVRFCQENHRFLPNHRPHNGTNRLRNWEYNPSARRYPYIDTNGWECSCKYCVCYERLGGYREDRGSAEEFFQREYYYYSRLNCTGISSLFKRLPEGMQLTVLILDGTDVGMGFVKEIFKSAWGGAWLKELSLRRCAKIEHSGVEKWLKLVFSRNWVHGLRVLKLWGCGTISPNGSFKPLYETVSPLIANSNTPGPGNHINNLNENMTQVNSVATSHINFGVSSNVPASLLWAEVDASNNSLLFGPSILNGLGGTLQNPSVAQTGTRSFPETGSQLNVNAATSTTAQSLHQNITGPLSPAPAPPVLSSSDVGVALAGIENDQNSVSNPLLGLTSGVGTAASNQDIAHPIHPGSSSSVSGVSLTPPVTISTTASVARLTRIVDPTLNLIRFCRQKKINLDIGLCVMKQQCFTLDAHENITSTQNLLTTVGGIAGLPPQQRGQVVLAEKRPTKRECCQEECKSIELEALCRRCVANMTCQKCCNFYCRKHDTEEHLSLLCAICGPCCDTCFEANTTRCTHCSEHFCNTHYPSGRCLIAFDIITGNIVAREEDDVIAEEEEEAEGRLYGDTLYGPRNRKFESCKSCKEVTCWECTDADGWYYCDKSGGGCGKMVCDNCASLTCGSCENMFCKDCADKMSSNCGVVADSYGNTISLSNRYDDDHWLCGNCYSSRQAEAKKQRDMDPLAMRALFGEKFSLEEICEVLGEGDIEKANKEGWLKRMLDEFDDYDMPDLIDPDDDESMPDLVDSDHDDDAASGQQNFDGDFGDGDFYGSANTDLNRSNDGINTTLYPPGSSGRDVRDEYLAVRSNHDEIGLRQSREKIKSACAKSIFEGLPNEGGGQDHEKPTISPENPSNQSGVEANVKSAKTITGVTATEQAPREYPGLGGKVIADIKSHRDQSPY